MRTDILNTTAIALLGRAGGFFVPFVIAAVFGSTRETDVFFLVYGGILCLMLVMGHLFESVMVPHITNEAERDRGIDRLVGATLTRTTIVIGLLLVATLVAFRPVLSATTQLPPESLDLAFQLFLLMSPIALLTAWTSTLIGALNAKKVFHVGAISPLFRSAVVIVFLIAFHDKWGIYSAACGYLFGEFLRLLAAIHAYSKYSHRLELTWAVNSATAEFFASAAYQTVGFGILCVTPIVNSIAASWLAVGDLSILAYALQLRNVPSLLFTAGLGTVVLSHWASGYSRGSEEFTWPRIQRFFGKLFLITIASTCVLVVCKSQIVLVVLGWGAFPHEKLPLVATLFAIFVIALPFDVITLLCVRLLIILKLDKTYLLLALLKLMLLIAFNCVLVPRYGLIGIGLATTTASTLHALALFYVVTQHRALLSDPLSSAEARPGSVSRSRRKIGSEAT